VNPRPPWRELKSLKGIQMQTLTSKLFVTAAAAVLVLAGCASPAAPGTDSDVAATAGESITITDAWVKSADEGMSATFGLLENSSDQDVTIVSATSPASSELELHETVDNGSGTMVMQQKEGGFVIPAGGSFTLEPGGNHIMLMDLTAPLAAGEEATFTVTFSDGSTFEFTAPVKDYTGANEEYVDGDMDMGD